MKKHQISHFDFFCGAHWRQTSTFLIWDLALITFWTTLASQNQPQISLRAILNDCSAFLDVCNALLGSLGRYLGLCVSLFYLGQNSYRFRDPMLTPRAPILDDFEVKQPCFFDPDVKLLPQTRISRTPRKTNCF